VFLKEGKAVILGDKMQSQVQQAIRDHDQKLRDKYHIQVNQPIDVHIAELREMGEFRVNVFIEAYAHEAKHIPETDIEEIVKSISGLFDQRRNTIVELTPRLLRVATPFIEARRSAVAGSRFKLRQAAKDFIPPMRESERIGFV
jgi:hypothetical protein